MGVKELTISHVKSHLQVSFSSSSIPSHLWQRLFVFVFPLEQPRAGAQINSKASDSSVCFSDEQMYRAARLGAGRRGERWNEPSFSGFFHYWILPSFLLLGCIFIYFTRLRRRAVYIGSELFIQYPGTNKCPTTVNWTFQNIFIYNFFFFKKKISHCLVVCVTLLFSSVLHMLTALANYS